MSTTKDDKPTTDEHEHKIVDGVCVTCEQKFEASKERATVLLQELLPHAARALHTSFSKPMFEADFPTSVIVACYGQMIGSMLAGFASKLEMELDLPRELLIPNLVANAQQQIEAYLQGEAPAVHAYVDDDGNVQKLDPAFSQQPVGRA